MDILSEAYCFIHLNCYHVKLNNRHDVYWCLSFISLFLILIFLADSTKSLTGSYWHMMLIFPVKMPRFFLGSIPILVLD